MRYSPAVPRLALACAQYRHRYRVWPKRAQGELVMRIVTEPKDVPWDSDEYVPEFAERVLERLECGDNGLACEVDGPEGFSGYSGELTIFTNELLEAFEWLYGMDWGVYSGRNRDGTRFRPGEPISLGRYPED